MAGDPGTGGGSVTTSGVLSSMGSSANAGGMDGMDAGLVYSGNVLTSPLATAPSA